MKRVLSIRKGVLALLLALSLGMGTAYAYNFSAVCSTGQTLYYNITDATNHYVEITCPGSSSWSGYTQPTGNIELPSYVTHNGVTYTVTAIGHQAFFNCSSLTGSLTIPNTVTSIGHLAFQGCIGFRGSLTFGTGVTSIGVGAFYGCTHFTGSLTIPDSVTEIQNSTFWSCSGFTGSLIIPNSVTYIGATAFQDCTGFTGSLTLGTGVTSIDDGAFYRCTGFTSITTLPETPPTLGTTVFYNVPTNIPVYVPCASLEDYQNYNNTGQPWGSFTNLHTLTCDGFPYVEDFEPACDWQLINGNLTNKWVWGEASTRNNHYLYISDNNGTTNHYTINSSAINSSAMVYAAKQFHFEEGWYRFQYDWLAYGESNYDYLRVALVPASVNLSAGTSAPSGFSYQSLPSGWIALDGGHQLSENAWWQTNFSEINVPTGDYMMVFAWRNDDSDGEQPPAAIDNVSIRPVTCLAPVGLTAQHVGRSQVSLDWTPVGNENEWRVWLSWIIGDETYYLPHTATTHPFTITGLVPGRTYTATVHAVCGPDNASLASNEISFTTSTDPCDDPVTFPFTENFDGYTGTTSGSVNVLPNCWSRINTTTVSSEQIYPTITEYSYAQSAPNFLFFMSTYYANTEYVDPQDQYAILPAVENVSDLVLSLSARIPAEGRNATFMVGVMTDPTDASTFREIASYQPTTTTYTQYSIPLNLYTGNGSYIAIKMPAASSSVNYRGLCIDDVSVNLDPLIYSINTDGVSVTVTGHVDGTNATGELVFPSTKTINGVTYTVTAIGDHAFDGCSGLTSIAIPNSVTSIENAAFFSCSGLTSVTIGNSVASIGEYAFCSCSGLTSVTIPNSVASIGEDAFISCSGLQSIVVASGNATYDSRNNCNAIIETSTNTLITGCQTTNIPNTVTSIKKYAFFGCSGLTSIAIPNSVTSIGHFAFDKCSGLTSITIPESVNYMGENPFLRCSSLVSIIVDEDNTVFDSRNNCNAIIKTSTNTLAVGCKNTVIPATVTSIGLRAFQQCSGLTSIAIPNSVNHIGEFAFLNCTDLTTITVLATTPPAVDYLAFYGFPNTIPVYVPFESLSAYQTNAGWSSLNNLGGYLCNFIGLSESNEAIVFADPAVKAICVQHWDTNHDGELSYAEAAAVTTLNPAGEADTSPFYNTSITSFDELQYFTGLTTTYAALKWCSDLVSVVLPSHITSIDDQCFVSCWSLASITIPSGVTSIGYEAFYDCRSLTSIVIPSGVTSIGAWAFNNCSGLTSITIPESVNYMGENPFMCCTSLVSIIVDEDNIVFDSRDNCNAIIKTSTNTLAVGCKNTVIPATVTSIGLRAFQQCSGLTSIAIPNSVNHIGGLAFIYCTGLTTITVLATTPPAVDYLAFYGFPNTIPVYVPCESLEAYQTYNNGQPWGGFTNIQCMVCSAELPLSENFDSYPGVTSGSENVLPDCWSRINTTTVSSEQGYPTIFQGSYAQSAPNFLYFMSTYAVGYFEDPQDQYAILPSIDNVSDLVLSLYARIPAEGRNATFMVGVMTDPEDASTFTELATYQPSSYTYTQYTIPFNNYTGNGQYIAIKMPAASSSVNYRGLAIDDLTLDIVSSPNIVFADANVKAICVDNWDTNHDGELSYAEAAAVTTLKPSGAENSVFWNTEITSFDELQYFTGLTSIEENAFMFCNSLTSVTLPNAVTSIGSYAFAHCISLTSVSLPNSLTTIGDFAFTNATSLSTIELPLSLMGIGMRAFDNCGLVSVVIPASVMGIGINPFTYCSSLTSITVDGPSNVFYTPNDNALVNSQTQTLVTGLSTTIIPNTVTTIGAFAFDGCINLTSITIPNSVTYIDNLAFHYCIGLTSITVEATTPPTLGNDVFQAVPVDIPVYVPCGTKAAYQAAAGWNAFTNIVDLCDVIVFADANVKAICVQHWDTNHDGELSYGEAAAVTSLGQVFQNAFQVEGTNVTFNELQYFTGLTSIGANAFAGCWRLTSVTLPPTVTTIGSNAFSMCSGLTSLPISNQVTEIGDFAFSYCYGLTGIELPSSVTSIGNRAFDRCYYLTSVVIPASVTSISFNPFSGCTALASIVVDEGNTVYGSPNGCNAIINTEDHLLVSGCNNTTIPDGVQTIGWYAFIASDLTTLTIPASVNSIADYAFSECAALSELTLLATTPPTLEGTDVFSYINLDIPVYVPCEWLELYQTYNNGQPWGGFTNIRCDGCSAELPLIENFESYQGTTSGATNVLPDCWDHINTAVDIAYSGYPTILNEPANAYSGSNYLRFHYDPNYGSEQYVILPYVDDIAEVDLWFYAKALTENAAIWIGVMTDPNDVNTFETAFEIDNLTSDYQQFNVSFDPDDINDQVHYIAIKSVANNGAVQCDLCIDNLELLRITQMNLTLSEGWNWWTPTVRTYRHVLQAALGSNGIVINSQNQGFQKYNGNYWNGTLPNVLEPGQMYKIKTNAAVSATLQGLEVGQTTITIVPGYTWFGYTGAQATDIATALDILGISPTDGDIITDKDGHIATYTGNNWDGTLTTLQPGHGYVYKR